ncbi:MAG: phytoene desaturase [Anaerolineales bacterium]|nr:phytoene desaturase [Anaerolineales bacterium]
MKPESAIIIGAGIGGLTAAAHLARRGMPVTILEKNEAPGGRCNRLVRRGHRFDTGPTLFVMPLLYEAEFRALGADMRARLDLQRVDPTYHLVFDDGARLALTSDMDCLRGQMEAVEPGSFRALGRYLKEGERHYQLVLDNLVNRDFRRLTDFFNLRNAPLLFQIKPLVNHYRNMAAYFNTPRLKNAFTFQDMYMGLSPFEAPATYSMMPYSELAHGVWYPRGGMYRVSEVLADLAREAGAEIVCNAAVERIEVNGARARGIRLADGSRLEADLILANADLPYVYRDLLPGDGSAKALLRKQFSCSVINFFWGLDRQFPDLKPHMLFLADDYRENFESIIRDKGLPANPTIYVHTPSRLDPAAAPPGRETLVATIPVGHMTDNGKQDWEALRGEARRHVFRRLKTIGLTGLERHIQAEAVYTPPSWAGRYNLVYGSTHGLSHRLTQMAVFRPANRHPRLKNLYFVGASTHPGTGMPTAMVSGRLVAERILDEQGN